MLGGVLLLALHGFLFADGAGHAGLTALAPIAAPPHASRPARSALGGELLRESLPSHDEGGGCMAAVVSLLMLLVGAAPSRGRCCARPIVLAVAAPVLTPPTPPPILLGVSRT
jgi:hypothetical protein